ncbi:MAG TPA: PQQ-binding-like beta-propeller repeat protein [Ktedonobacteraceae bacterium]|nr:PQQ-binding-like beta-propeller repeat protein [Ktedonobacteraceae bacterium]
MKQLIDIQPCPQWAKKLAALHPGDLTSAEQANLQAHIQSCPACAAVIAEYREMDARILALPPVAPLPDLPLPLRAAFGETAQQETIHVTEQAHASRHSTILKRKPPRPTSRFARAASAFAAVLVVAALIAGFLLLFTAHHSDIGNVPSGSKVVVVASERNDGTIYAIRPSDGAIYWHQSIGKQLTGALVVTRDVVIVGSYNGHVYAVNKRDGSVLWDRSIGTAALPPFASDGTAVYVSGENAVYALRTSDGEILWHRGKTQGCDNGACTNVAMGASGGKVFAFFPDGLYALRAADGTILWRNPVFRFTTRSFVLLNDKLYLPVEAKGLVYVLSTGDGNMVHSPLSFIKDQPIEMVASSDVVYVDSGGQEITAIRASDDRALWRKHFDTVIIGLSSSSDGRLYVAQTTTYVSSIQIIGQPQPTVTSSGYSTDVYALNASDGSILWRWQPTNASGGSSDIAAADGNMYVVIGDSLYALHGSDGKVLWRALQGEQLSSPVIG